MLTIAGGILIALLAIWVLGGIVAVMGEVAPDWPLYGCGCVGLVVGGVLLSAIGYGLFLWRGWVGPILLILGVVLLAVFAYIGRTNEPPPAPQLTEPVEAAPEGALPSGKPRIRPLIPANPWNSAIPVAIAATPYSPEYAKRLVDATRHPAATLFIAWRHEDESGAAIAEALWRRLVQATDELTEPDVDSWADLLSAVLQGLEKGSLRWMDNQDFRDLFILLEGCLRAYANREVK